MQKIGHRIIFLGEVKSTNTYVQELPDDQKSHGLIVATYNQTQGRGQRDNSWHMQADKNIALSLLLSDGLPKVEYAYVLNVLTALAVADTAALYTHDKTYIKWPNDIILRDKKVAGILIENVLQGDSLRESVVGIGLNVNQQEWKDVPTAVSLSSASAGAEIDLIRVQESLIELLGRYWDFYNSQKIEELWTAYNARLYRGGKLSLPTGERISPIAVQADGELVAEHLSGAQRTYKHGELSWNL